MQVYIQEYGKVWYLNVEKNVISNCDSVFLKKKGRTEGVEREKGAKQPKRVEWLRETAVP